MPEPRTCGKDCPHHYHNHPTVKINEHDAYRMKLSEQLIKAIAWMLKVSVTRPGHFADFLDMLPILGQALDQLRPESPDLVMYMARQEQTQESAVRYQAGLARRGDIDTLIKYSDELERKNPLPIVEVS